MSDEFRANFLSKNSLKDDRLKEFENETDNEYKEYSAEIKMSENFYSDLFEKLKSLCNDEPNSKINVKSNLLNIKVK